MRRYSRYRPGDGIRSDAAGVAAEWTLIVANGLSKRFPAIVDEFVLASGDEHSHSGQALLVQTVNAKLAILTSARKGIPA